VCLSNGRRSKGFRAPRDRPLRPRITVNVQTSTSFKGRRRTIETAWWKEAVIYQIYPPLFYGANGDGVGNLPAYSKNCPIWLTSAWIWYGSHLFFKSPMCIFGRIFLTCTIHRLFGSMSDFNAVLTESQRLGLKLAIGCLPTPLSIIPGSRTAAALGGGPPTNRLLAFRGSGETVGGSMMQPNNTNTTPFSRRNLTSTGEIPMSERLSRWFCVSGSPKRGQVPDGCPLIPLER
jgi:hypothetical protein